MSKEGHLERTAREPRNPGLHLVFIKQIDEINDTIRIFRLEIPDNSPAIKFLPGQWVDTFCPGVPAAGGFTITSPPSKAVATPEQQGYIELAVQKSPDGPPAQWLWRPESDIMNAELQIRIGGNFVYPPPGVPVFQLRKIVFVAGGVGINPLISMLSHLAEQRDVGRYQVHFLYSMKDPGGERDASKILFLQRLATIFGREKVKGKLKLFLTGNRASDGETEGVVSCNEVDVPFCKRRIVAADLVESIGQDRRFSAVYVCSVPAMTDEFVEQLTMPHGVGIEPHRVLYEKWW